MSSVALWWPRGIMGFTRAFRNLQGKFSTVIATFNFQKRFNFSTAIQFFNAQLRLQLSTAIQFFNAQLRLHFQPRFNFQRSTAIPTFSPTIPTSNRDSNFQPRFQLSTAIPTSNRNFMYAICYQHNKGTTWQSQSLSIN